MNRIARIGIPLAVLSIATLALAQDGAGRSPSYDLKHEVVLHGTAAEVRAIPDWMGAQGVNVTLRTPEAELVHVDTAPAEFLKLVDFSLAAGDELEVTGAWSTIDGKPVFLAHSVRKHKVTISLRAADGRPVW